MGKSRLLNEFCRELRADAVTILAGRCLANRSAMPYLPMLEVVRRLCEITVTDRPETCMTKLSHRLHDLSPDLAERVPYILRLFGLSESTDRLSALNPNLLRARTGAAICQILLCRSHQQPMVISIEDLHDIDRASEACLTALCETLAETPLLLLTTYRPTYQPPWLERIKTASATQFDMTPLTDPDSLRLIEANAAPHSLPNEQKQLILQRTAGHPLFLEEATRQLADAAFFGRNPSLPETLQDVIRMRIEQLPDGPQRALQIAAVLGTQFTRHLLQTVWEGSDNLETCMAELNRQTGWLSQPSAEEPVYTFNHTLIQDVVYTHLPEDQRQALHAMAGQALAAEHADRPEPVADLIAYHDFQSAEATKAIESLTYWAATATRHGADAEAVTALQNALTCVDHLPHEDQHRHRPDLLLRLAHARVTMGNWQEALTLLTQQWDSHHFTPDPQPQSQRALLLGQTCSHLDDWASAAQHAQHALDLSTSCRDEEIMGQAHDLLAQERYWFGYPIEGAEHSRHAVTLLNASSPPWCLARLAMAHFVHGLNTLLLGDFTQTLQAADQIRTIGQSIGEPHLITFAEGLTGWTQATSGEPETGVQTCQRSLDAAPDPLSAALARGWLGYAYLEHDTPNDAIPLLEQAVKQLRQFQRRRFESLYLAFLGDAYRRCNDPTARHVLDESLSLAQASAYRTGAAWAQRALGRLAASTDAVGKAAEYFRAALQTFDAMQARFESARTHLDLAELVHRQGYLKTALRHFNSAATQFQALHVPTYVERVRQRTHALGFPTSTTLPL